MNYNKSADAQYKRMTETPVNKLIATLAVPTVISMLITMIYNMADTYFVSKISVAASGATGVVLSLMAIFRRSALCMVRAQAVISAEDWAQRILKRRADTAQPLSFGHFLQAE